MAINSTPPPSITPALAPKAAPPGSSAAKLPSHSPGTPVYPPQSLPGRPPVNSTQPPRAAGAPALPAAPLAAGATAAAATAAPVNATAAQTPAAAPDKEAAPVPQAEPKAPASATSTRGRAKNSAPARPGTPAAIGGVGVPAASAATAAGEAAPAASDESASSLQAAQESPADSERAGPATQAARDGATPGPAATIAPGPVLPVIATAPASPEAMAAGPAAAPPAAAALPVAASRTAPAASAASPSATASDLAAGLRSGADGSAADPGQTGADSAALLSDPASVRTSPGAAASATPALTVHTDVGASGWTDEIGAHVVWMAHQGVTDASLRLQPEHLGPLEVKISLHDSDASVWFGASAPATRAALEQALPQLKEMFAAQGMTLTDAGVSRESSREAQYAPRPGAATSAADAQNATPVAVAAPRRGLIDTYA